MTKYLIIILVFVILILLVILTINRNNRSSLKPQSSPSNSQTNSFQNTPPPSMSTQDQIKAQEQADRNYAETTKQIDTQYPWLDKLPLQVPNTYYVYFDINQKQFIAKLYPKASSSIPVDQQVENFKKEIQSKLLNLIPNYTNYPISWDIKPQP